MTGTVLFVAGMLGFLVGVIVRLAGDKPTGGTILLAGAAGLIVGRVVGGIGRQRARGGL